MSTEGTEYR